MSRIASGGTARCASCTMCNAGNVTARSSGNFGNSARMRSRNSSFKTAIVIYVSREGAKSQRNIPELNHKVHDEHEVILYRTILFAPFVVLVVIRCFVAPWRLCVSL